MTKRLDLAAPVVLFCLGAGLALGGCAADADGSGTQVTAAGPQPQSPSVNGRLTVEEAEAALKACGADRFQDRIGGPLIGSTAMEPEKGTFLKASELPQPNRILPPNSMMTRDFNPLRLNVFLNNRMDVIRIVCG